MNILFASSEVAPFIKTGGLADVAGSLPQALAKEGHQVTVILPLYQGVSQFWRDQMTFLKHFNVSLSWRQAYCGLFQLEREGVTYWFVDNEYYFKRAQIYGHFDDCERFAFFSRAVLAAPAQLDWAPDIIHCNDWQTALVPVYLLEERYRVPQLSNAHAVFTIHNIEYQGRYGEQVLQDVIGQDSSYFNEGMLAYFGDVNLMKGAILASSQVTTVSPTYAQELHTPFYARGMDGVICQQDGKFCGILNGIDMDLYDPAACADLPEHYSAKDLTGKAACKAALQRAMGLQEDPYIPPTPATTSWAWTCRWWSWAPASGSMRRHSAMPRASIPAALPPIWPTPPPCPTWSTPGPTCSSCPPCPSPAVSASSSPCASAPSPWCGRPAV